MLGLPGVFEGVLVLLAHSSDCTLGRCLLHGGDTLLGPALAGRMLAHGLRDDAELRAKHRRPESGDRSVAGGPEGTLRVLGGRLRARLNVWFGRFGLVFMVWFLNKRFQFLDGTNMGLLKPTRSLSFFVPPSIYIYIYM